jgi:hypothetical protein
VIFLPNSTINYIFGVKLLLIFSVIFSLMYSLRIIFFLNFSNKKYKKNILVFFKNYKIINNILYCFYFFILIIFYLKIAKFFLPIYTQTNVQVAFFFKILFWFFFITFILNYFYNNHNMYIKINLKKFFFLCILIFVLIL